MLQGVFDCDALDGVERKQTLQQVQSKVGSLGEHGLPRNLLLERKRPNVLPSTAGLDAVVVFHSWCTQNIEDEGKLVVICKHGSVSRPNAGSDTLTVLSREQWLAAQHLGQNASHTPHVNGFGVFLERKHDLRCSVPTRSNVFRHETRVVFSRGGRSRETKVADLEIAIGVKQQVGRLKITMQDIGRVHRLESTQRLVDEVLTVVVGKLLRTNDAVHVRLHEFLRFVNQCFCVRSRRDIPESDRPR
jgi:hypothetical protein